MAKTATGYICIDSSAKRAIVELLVSCNVVARPPDWDSIPILERCGLLMIAHAWKVLNYSLGNLGKKKGVSSS